MLSKLHFSYVVETDVYVPSSMYVVVVLTYAVHQRSSGFDDHFIGTLPTAAAMGPFHR